MTRARLVDVPAIALLIARWAASLLMAQRTPATSQRDRTALTESELRRLYVLGLLPVALLIIAMEGRHFHHHNREVAVSITPRRTRQRDARLISAAILALVGATYIFISLQLPDPLVWTTAAFLILIVASSTALYVKALRPGHQPTEKFTTDWRVGLLISKSQQWGILETAELARKIVQPGQSIGLVASDAQRALVYSRFGFIPIHPGSLTMTYTRPREPAKNPHKGKS